MAQSILPLIILGIIALATYNLADPKKKRGSTDSPGYLDGGDDSSDCGCDSGGGDCGGGD